MPRSRTGHPPLGSAADTEERESDLHLNDSGCRVFTGLRSVSRTGMLNARRNVQMQYNNRFKRILGALSDTDAAQVQRYLQDESLQLAKIPNIDQAKFEELANKAKEGCPVSKVLNADITLSATLES